MPHSASTRSPQTHKSAATMRERQLWAPNARAPNERADPRARARRGTPARIPASNHQHAPRISLPSALLASPPEETIQSILPSSDGRCVVSGETRKKVGWAYLGASGRPTRLGTFKVAVGRTGTGSRTASLSSDLDAYLRRLAHDLEHSNSSSPPGSVPAGGALTDDPRCWIRARVAQRCWIRARLAPRSSA